jgi:hypothetical protein
MIVISCGNMPAMSPSAHNDTHISALNSGNVRATVVARYARSRNADT